MSNFNKASKLASEWVESMGGLDNISYRHGDDVSGLVQAIDDAGLLAPDLQIIRTPEELEVLDPNACTLDKFGDFDFAKAWIDESGKMFVGHVDFLPAVVFATGDQVRAAREAMEKYNG